MSESVKKVIRCAVVCHCGGGDPDVFFVKVQGCTKDQINNGWHYRIAKHEAYDHGYEDPMIAFDEYDAAGQALVGLIEDWDCLTVPTVEL